LKMKVKLSKSAKKDIKKLDKDIRNRVYKEIRLLRQRVTGMTRLKGDKNNINIEGLVYVEIKGKNLYALYLTAQSGNFSDYKSVFMDIIDNFYVMVPEKKQGWNVINESSDLFFLQYPSTWVIEQKKSDRFSSISISPADTEWINGINILYFRSSGKENIDTVTEDLLSQFEALGYSTPEKINGKFINFPASIIKIKRDLRDNTNSDVYTTVTTFMRDDVIIQIYMSYAVDTDQDIKDTCNEILNTFRPFTVKSEK